MPGGDSFRIIVQDVKTLLELADSLCDLLQDGNPLKPLCELLIQFVGIIREVVGPILDMMAQ